MKLDQLSMLFVVMCSALCGGLLYKIIFTDAETLQTYVALCINAFACFVILRYVIYE